MADDREAAGDLERAPGRRPPNYQEPTFGQRLLARLIDSVVLLPVLAVLGVIASDRAQSFSWLMIVALYEIVLVTRRGQTLGKMALRTRVVDRATGARPSLGQAATRWLTVIAGPLVAVAVPAVGPLAAVCTLIVIVPAVRPPLHLGLHDLTAHTIVTSTAA